MKGYKVFNSDWTCKGYQYEVGKTYEMEGKPIICEQGFHFCLDLIDCFNYYSHDSNNKVAEVEALGDIDKEENNSKHCTNKIEIVREIPWDEVQKLVNTGKENSGLGNSGNSNTGNSNTGSWNTGNRNTGYLNTGNSNTGNRNTGDWNTGDSNTGNSNTGNRNTGSWNTGNRNTGDWNTGDWNTGNRNTGDWNSASFSSGVFNTKKQTILMFDKPSNWTLFDWWNCQARCILIDMPYDDVIIEDGKAVEKKVTVEEKQKWWNELSRNDKECVKSLPNFDAAIFKKITGIEV